MKTAVLFSLLFAATVIATPPMRQGQLPVDEQPPAKEVAPVVVIPIPRGDPTSFVLSPDVMLIFDTNDEAIFTSSPQGHVKISKEPGPIKIRAKFAGNPNKFQTRTFAGKWVYTIEPLNTGKCELLAWTIGEKDAENIQRFQVDVNLGPRPPPDVDPDVTPKPTPGKDIHVLFVFESGVVATREQLHVKNSTTLRKYMDSKWGKDSYRFFDPDINVDNESPTWKAIWASAKPELAGKPLPQMVIYQGAKGVGQPVTTEAAALSALKKLGGE